MTGVLRSSYKGLAQVQWAKWPLSAVFLFFHWGWNKNFCPMFPKVKHLFPSPESGKKLMLNYQNIHLQNLKLSNKWKLHTGIIVKLHCQVLTNFHIEKVTHAAETFTQRFQFILKQTIEVAVLSDRPVQWKSRAQSEEQRNKGKLQMGCNLKVGKMLASALYT